MEKQYAKSILKSLITETVSTLEELNDLKLTQDSLLNGYIMQLKAGDGINLLLLTERCLETTIEESFEKTRYLKFLTEEREYYMEQLKA